MGGLSLQWTCGLLVLAWIWFNVLFDWNFSLLCNWCCVLLWM